MHAAQLFDHRCSRASSPLSARLLPGLSPSSTRGQKEKEAQTQKRKTRNGTSPHDRWRMLLHGWASREIGCVGCGKVYDAFSVKRRRDSTRHGTSEEMRRADVQRESPLKRARNTQTAKTNRREKQPAKRSLCATRAYSSISSRSLSMSSSVRLMCDFAYL